MDIKSVLYQFQHTTIAVELETSRGSQCIVMVEQKENSSPSTDSKVFETFYSTEDEGKTAVESIHNQIHEILGDTNYSLKIDTEYFPLPILKDLKTTIITSKISLDSKTLNRFFSASPNLKTLEIFDLSTGGVNRSPKLFRVDDLKIGGSAAQISAILQNFKGRHGQFSVLENSPNFDVAVFVKDWMTGKSYQNLESLNIFVSMNVKKVKGILGAQQLKSDSNWPRFEVPEREEIDFTTSSYVVRGSDRRVASVLVEKKRFWFGVWKITEDEFLQKFEQ